MKRYLKICLYGFLVWLIPFVVGCALYEVRENDRILFETIMPVVVTVSAVLFALLYFGKAEAGFLKQGVLIGVIWFVINVVLDLCMFMEGPMKMTFADYMKDIGLTYLIIPAVTIGFGYLLEKRLTSKQAKAGETK
ncbi:unnamed protein product [marine sediment metagenome]|uniref:Lipoprotein n=1 Tax=marine sediment metagenome TaxID=412755 RepID=X0U526_9ZZZZ